MKAILFFGSLLLLLVGSNSVCQDLARFESEVENISKKEFLRDANKHLVLFTGSSSVRLWTDLQASFPKVQTHNTGFGGSTMKELLHFSDELILRFSPEKVFIYEGDNDIVLGHTTDQIMEACQTLCRKIQNELPRVKIILIAAKPSVARWEHKAKYVELNQAFKDLARKSRRIKYADIWSPMLGKDKKPMPDIFIEDNLHMNAKGYEIWKKVLLKYI